MVQNEILAKQVEVKNSIINYLKAQNCDYCKVSKTKMFGVSYEVIFNSGSHKLMKFVFKTRDALHKFVKSLGLKIKIWEVW